MDIFYSFAGLNYPTQLNGNILLQKVFGIIFLYEITCMCIKKKKKKNSLQTQKKKNK